MAKQNLKSPSTERLIFWSVALLLFIQLTWWTGLQVRESRALREARIAQMRAGRAEAWQMDSMAFLRINLPQDPSEGPGVVGRYTEVRSLDERRQIIEERYPYVTVEPTREEPDDPQLLADQPAFLTLRPEVLRAMDRERTLALWRTTGMAALVILAVLLGMTYIYRKLNSEMELMLRQRNFVAAVTHELKTPIASLRVWVETLFTRNLGEERRRRVQDLMEGDLARLTELVQNLLDAARAEAGGLDIQPVEMELAPLVREVAEAMDQRLGPGVLGLELDLAPDIVCAVDPRAFATVLENLLSNAYKYASEPRRTRLVLDGTPEEAVLVVSDRGHGLPSRELGRIFQRFYRVGDEMTRSVPGTGLGLFLCAEILHQLKGSIKASSLGMGLGTSFTIRLPRAAR